MRFNNVARNFISATFLLVLGFRLSMTPLIASESVAVNLSQVQKQIKQLEIKVLDIADRMNEIEAIDLQADYGVWQNQISGVVSQQSLFRYQLNQMQFMARVQRNYREYVVIKTPDDAIYLLKEGDLAATELAQVIQIEPGYAIFCVSNAVSKEECIQSQRISY